MKVCIVGFNVRNIIPYIENYENILKEYGIEYDCIFWDRYSDLPIEIKENEYTIHIKCVPGANKLGKIIPMYKYKKIVESIIHKQKYTHLIILTTLPGVLISNLLFDKYKEKYILDIRDYTYEKYSFYKNIVDRLVEESYFTAISSKGFLRFLKNSKKIVPCHNIGVGFKEENLAQDLKSKNKIIIGFVGGVRYYKENCALIDALANNPKYDLLYIGKPNSDCDLKSYCINNNIKNVFFEGEFKNSDKPEIYEKIDIINSYYGSKNLEVITLLPNRLYDGLLLKKPIIASDKTYLGNIVKDNYLGIVIDTQNNQDINCAIEKFLNQFENKKFTIYCNNVLRQFRLEQKNFCNQIKQFLLKKDE